MVIVPVMRVDVNVPEPAFVSGGPLVFGNPIAFRAS